MGISAALSKHDLEQYREQGFLVLDSLLSRAELERLDSIVPEITARLMQRPDEKEHIFEKDREGRPVALRCVHNLLGQHPFFRELAARDRLVDCVAAVMSPDLFFFRGILVIKQHGVGSAFPWHQDFAYWGKGRPELVGAWIALKEATVENGCMDLIPGSHRWGVLPVRDNDPGNPILTSEQKGLALPAPVPAGSAILFHSLLVHRSNPNRSESDRWAVVYEYSSPGFGNGRHRFDRSCGWDPRSGKMLHLED